VGDPVSRASNERNGLHHGTRCVFQESAPSSRRQGSAVAGYSERGEAPRSKCWLDALEAAAIKVKGGRGRG